MRLLAFQHTPGETPGAFGQQAARHGDTLHVTRLFAGDDIPDLAQFDALIVMGGPMDIWEEAAYPWLIAEKAAIRAWVQTDKPYLGICLGHQLLIDAMGGTCRKMAVPEIGVTDVTLTDVASDPVLSVLPTRFPALHWHGVEAETLPPDTLCLGASAGCATQVIRLGRAAWGTQFHPEIEPGTLTGWMEDPANLQAAIDWLGSSEVAHEFVAVTEAQSYGFVDRATLIYAAFRQQVLPLS